MSELMYCAYISSFYWGGVWVELSPFIKLKELTMQRSFVQLVHSCNSFLLLLRFA